MNRIAFLISFGAWNSKVFCTRDMDISAVIEYKHVRFARFGVSSFSCFVEFVERDEHIPYWLRCKLSNLRVEQNEPSFLVHYFEQVGANRIIYRQKFSAEMVKMAVKRSEGVALHLKFLMEMVNGNSCEVSVGICNPQIYHLRRKYPIIIIIIRGFSAEMVKIIASIRRRKCLDLCNEMSNFPSSFYTF